MNKLLIITLLLPLVLQGQVSLDETNRRFVHQVPEHVVCFTDRNLYLSGDALWFSAFVFVNGRADEQTLSDVLYVELFNRSEKVIASAKYRIRQNQCRGRFNIPPETLSGAFFVRFYTRYQRNFDPSTWELIPVTVVNTGLTLPASKGNTAEPASNDHLHEIKVSAGKTTFNTREKVTLDIAPPDDFSGWLNISVARKGSITDQLNETEPVPSKATDSVFHVPDVRGVSLTGIVNEKNGSPDNSGIPVYLSAFGNNNLLHITETSTNGVFMFSLNGLEGLTNVFVSINPDTYSGKQMLINTGFSNRYPALPPHGFRIDSTYHQLLSAMLVDQETMQAFGEIPAIPTGRSLNNLPVTYDLTVKLDDYIELASLSEVIYEIVPPVSVRTRAGQKSLYVANYQTQQVASAGLILLDDVPVFNVNELLKIPPVNIERIDVINRPYYLGDHLLESMVSIKTRTGDFGGYRFPEQSSFLEYQAFAGEQDFVSPDYRNRERLESPLPDFRTTLFWEPALPAGTVTSITLFTSDARGEYDVMVRGVSATGEQIYGKSSITVK